MLTESQISDIIKKAVTVHAQDEEDVGTLLSQAKNALACMQAQGRDDGRVLLEVLKDEGLLIEVGEPVFRLSRSGKTTYRNAQLQLIDFFGFKWLCGLIEEKAHVLPPFVGKAIEAVELAWQRPVSCWSRATEGRRCDTFELTERTKKAMEQLHTRLLSIARSHSEVGHLDSNLYDLLVLSRELKFISGHLIEVLTERSQDVLVRSAPPQWFTPERLASLCASARNTAEHKLAATAP